MYSEDDPRSFEDTAPVGRTWADMVYSARWPILIFISIIVLVIVGAVFRDDIGSFVAKYSDQIKIFAAAFVLFFLIGRYVTKVFFRVPTVDYLVLDFESFRGEIYRIPVPLLSDLAISGGNNLTFSWRTGDGFRLARKVDLENGIIETAWPHEVPIEQAAFTLADLQRRESDYERLSIENLYLRRRPTVIATELAARSNRYLADEISDVLKLDGLDLDSYLNGLDPLRERREPESGGEDDGEQVAE